jgi:hypothetical protein
VTVNTENVTAVGKDPNPGVGVRLLCCTQSAESVLQPSPISTTPRLALGPTQPPVRWILGSILGVTTSVLHGVQWDSFTITFRLSPKKLLLLGSAKLPIRLRIGF